MVENEMNILSETLTINTQTIIGVISILIIAYLASKLVTFVLTVFSERAWQYRIKIKMLLPLLKFSIYGFAIYYILKNIIGISAQELIIFGGLLGAAIGFGLKDLFADLVGGIVITLEKPYQVGDKISMGGNYGEVKDIGLRATKIITPDDNLVSIPNYLVFGQSVSSANAGNPEMMVVIDLFLDHGCDMDIAKKILREAVVTSRYVYLSEKHPVTILEKNYPFYVRLRAKAYVSDLRYEFNFESDVTKRAWEEMDKKGINPPMASVVDMGSEESLY